MKVSIVRKRRKDQNAEKLLQSVYANSTYHSLKLDIRPGRIASKKHMIHSGVEIKTLVEIVHRVN